MVNPFAPYLSIINFALEPILKIGFAIVVARIVMVALGYDPRSGSPWVGSSRRSGRSFRGSEMRRILIFCVAVSLAAACFCGWRGRRAGRQRQQRLRDRNEHVRRR